MLSFLEVSFSFKIVPYGMGNISMFSIFTAPLLSFFFDVGIGGVDALRSACLHVLIRSLTICSLDT